MKKHILSFFSSSLKKLFFPLLIYGALILSVYGILIRGLGILREDKREVSR